MKTFSGDLMNKMLTGTLAMALAGSATTAFGAVKEGSLSVTPAMGLHVYDGAQHLDPTAVLGVRGGYSITRSIGIEALYDYVTSSSASSAGLKDISMHRFGGQALYHFFPDKALVPYLAAGYSRINFSGSGVNNKNHGQFDYGAGVKYFLTDDIAVRGDIRHILYNYDAKTFSNAEITLGAHFQFGSATRGIKVVASETAQPRSVETGNGACPPPPKPEACAPAQVPEPVACAPSPPPAPVACAPVACTPVACTPAPEVIKFVPVPVTREACETLWAADNAEKAAAAAGRHCEPPAKITILYTFGKVLFKADYHEKLDQIGNFLKEFPNSRIIISGHTDSAGSKEENLQSSLVRAAVARSHIIYKFKIDRSRILIKGYGADRPVASNKTEAGKAKNRRIEVTFSCE